MYAPSDETLSWYRGALGEMAVAGILEWLGDGWTVLHSVPVGDGDTDIDHVVIGPAGVFTINTKSHPGQDIWIGGHGLLVSGRRTNYIGLATAEAARAERLLTDASGLVVPVTPLIVLVNPGRRTVKAAPEGGVRVVADWELLGSLEGRPVFSQEQVDRIVAAAVRPETWHASGASDIDTRTLAIQFDAIVARELHGAVPAPLDGASAALPHEARQPTKARARAAQPATPRRKTATGSRRRSGRSSALVKLAGIGVAIWMIYGVLIPAVQASLTR
ncbi:nuclease-related domain-containing protein [Naasia sp. SYSU D00948]|uniref:nuclease-related domain-containing protein n=1 Tax=Naasia sp. SYSU D00948 TaxID=2817379 RepID=UPI001B31824A|nr:nuclease-related domain-containing protein [Naasia sp. SYSU D00948]